ncbi:serine hydrolase [Micromonospora sp. DT4]|uniref:serine hydrolase n=1 Tax=Micromonospora sp. DT4 TaxID=3393438 RepID=UPI003CF85595
MKKSDKRCSSSLFAPHPHVPLRWLAAAVALVVVATTGPATADGPGPDHQGAPGYGTGPANDGPGDDGPGDEGGPADHGPGDEGGPADESGRSDEPGLEPAPERAPTSEVSWLSFPGGAFAVDSLGHTVRYRACDGDTGRVADPGMRVAAAVASGEVTVDGRSFRYRVPLVGRSTGTLVVSGPQAQPVEFSGVVVTSPQPPTDPVEGTRLFPLSGQLARVVADASLNPAGATVRDLSGRYGDQQISVNGALRPKAASVIKLWILVELLRRVDCAQVSLDDGVLVTPADVVGGTGQLQFETFPQVVTLHRLAQYLIKYSDNVAANVLITYLGGFAPVNALIDSMNQRSTILARRMLDTAAAQRGEENYTSPDDVVSLLGAVWDGEILTPASRDLMIGFMREQTLNTKIPAALPPGVPVAHKTGDLPDASHDVGYYLIPGTETAVAFLTAGPMETGDETVRRMARTVYDFLVTPSGGALEE